MAERIQELSKEHEESLAKLDAQWQDKMAAKIEELVSSTEMSFTKFPVSLYTVVTRV